MANDRVLPLCVVQNVTIGYDSHKVADEISLEIDHGARVAISAGVWHNGHTNHLPSEPCHQFFHLAHLIRLRVALNGDMAVMWVPMPSMSMLVLPHFLNTRRCLNGFLPFYPARRVSDTGTPSQRILDLAGAMLFRGIAVQKKIKVLSGGDIAVNLKQKLFYESKGSPAIIRF